MKFAIASALMLAALGAGATSAPPPSLCHVTTPNGVVAGSSDTNDTSYGNQLLSVGPFGLWPEGTVIFKPGGAGFVRPDGSLEMKFGWTRGVPGKLTITGRRLDAPTPPLRANIPNGYGETGFQATSLIFSTPGCWEVTALVGQNQASTLTFITKVEKIGGGPASPN